MKLKAGDHIRLKHKWFNSENINSINDESKLLELPDFTAVSIWLPTLGIRGEHAKAIFDSTISTISEIEYFEEKPWFVRTNLFHVNLTEAIETSEIEIITSNDSNISSIETELINDLDFFESEYLKGLFDILERENNKMDCYNRAKHQMINDKKWLNK